MNRNNKKNIEGIIFLVLGILLVIVVGVELIGYISGEPIKYTSYRFGTLSGWTAISTRAASFIAGIIFIIWGVLAIKMGHGKSA